VEKPKKRRRGQTTLERIVFGRKFGFYAPFTIEECAELLLSRSERKPEPFGNPNKLLISVKEINPDFYTFRLFRDAGRGLHGEVLGTFTRAEEATLVEGRARIGLYTLSFLVLTSPGWLTVLVLLIGSGIPFLWMQPLIVIGVLLGMTIRERERLCKLTFTILDKNKQA
jgi:hypothetical protein